MTVSFTGIQNIGVTWKTSRSNPKAFLNRIAIQLTNDGEKDLDAFQDLLIKHNDYFKSNFLDLIFDYSPNNINPKKPYLDVFVNTKKLELNQENLPFFAKINNLLERIAKGEEKKPITPGYVESKNCLGRFLSEIYGKKDRTSELLQGFHETWLAETIAYDTSKALTKAMKGVSLFGTNPLYKEINGVGGFHFAEPERDVDRLYLQLKAPDVKLFEKFFWSRKLMPTHSKNLMIDVVKNGSTQKTELSLNNIALEVNEENLPIIKRVVQLLKGIKETDKELPFPRNYLTDASFDEISKGVIKGKDLKQMYTDSWEEKLENDVKMDLITHDKGAKEMADKIVTAFEKKVLEFFS